MERVSFRKGSASVNELPKCQNAILQDRETCAPLLDKGFDAKKCNKIVFQPKACLIWFPLMIYGQIFCLLPLSSFRNSFFYCYIPRACGRCHVILSQMDKNMRTFRMCQEYSDILISTLLTNFFFFAKIYAKWYRQRFMKSLLSDII
jgi:hypothetical protein